MVTPDPASNNPEKNRYIFRDGIFALAFVYVFLVTFLALSLLVLFLVKALGGLPGLEWKYLLGLAVGTGGLGAGSLVFRSIIEKVIER
jgi:hypothetical protein